MLFHIRHELEYGYERPVFLEPMTVRLTPRQDPAQRLLRHSVTVEEEADGCSRILEADGSEVLVLWFERMRDRLNLTVESVVQTSRVNPFDWIVTHPATLRLPASYPAAETASLAPCRAGAIDPLVAGWAAEQADAAGGATTVFLLQLAEAIHTGFHHVGRPEGEPMVPAETLATRTGACRDTAMLYVAACRSQGLAARFVSGYSMHHPPEVSEQELHAWAEVYVPGGGWRGYDPSLGLAVADGHVVLAAAPDHDLAAPVTGTYRGTGVESRMRYTVQLKAGPDPGAGEA